ncbi:hypothetical protein AeMF1_008725 [Aphanomyces euteiches]|nr:hypothetical protein AeMF1_008725 [Aphanomyces euteiches]
MKKFVMFLSRYNDGGLSLETISADDITQDLFGKFAAFLVSDPDIGFSTSTTYLSSVKRQIVEVTRTRFFDNNTHWYKTLRSTLRRTYIEQTTARGVPLQDKAPLMTLEDLRVITTRLWMRNEPRSMKDRTLLVLQWALFGRSSDVGDVVFEQLQWTGSYLLVRVNRKKTVQQHSVSVFSTALEWSYDPLHSLAAELASDPFGLSDRVFSQIAFEKAQQDNVSGYINRLLNGLNDKANEIQFTRNLRSHSSRRGAAVVAATCSETMDGYNTILQYIAETSHSDQKVARVLGGWQQPTQMIEPAKLEAVGAKATQQQAFARRLFANYMSRLQKESLVFALAAVLLLYYSDTHSTCPRHVVHDTMVTACTVACGLTKPDDAEETLRVWCSSVRQRFVRENVARLPLPDSSEGDVLRSNFGSTLNRVVHAQSDTASNVAALRGEVQHQGDVQQELMRLQQHLFNQQMAMIEQQTKQLESLAAMQASIASFAQNFQPSSLPVSLSNDLNDASCVVPSVSITPCLPPPRKWPTDMTALRGWMMSSLLYRYWSEQLDTIPLDPACRAQRDARSIATIARNLLGPSVPVPPGDSPSSQWQESAMAAAVEAQRLALARVNATSVIRKRKKTGSALGILRAWKR